MAHRIIQKKQKVPARLAVCPIFGPYDSVQAAEELKLPA
jgi:hypothetical protein